jgi:hypothetical protein
LFEDNHLPALGHAQETTNDRAQYRTHEGRSGENRHGQTTLVRIEEIRNNTTSVCKRTGSKSGSEKSKDEKTVDIWCSSSGSIEGDKGDVGTSKNELAAVELTEWCPPIAKVSRCSKC